MKNQKKIMKILQRMVSFVLVISLMLGMTSIEGEARTAKRYVKSFQVKKSVSVNVGDKIRISPKLKVTKNTNKKLKVKVKNSKIAKATYSAKSKKIIIAGKKAGKTSVTVTTLAKNKKGKRISRKIKVTVKNNISTQTTQTTQNNSANTETVTSTTQTTQATTTEEPDRTEEKTPLVTRMDWIKELVNAIGISTVQDENAVQYSFSDVEEEADKQILNAAVRNGILDYTEGAAFNPDDVATREFAAVTAVKAAGFQLAEDAENLECEDGENLECAQYDKVAVEKEMLSLDGTKFNPEEGLDLTEKETCLEMVENLWNEVNAPFEPKMEVEYQDDVICDEIEGLTDYTISETETDDYEVVIQNVPSNVSLEPNKFILLPGNEEYPTGFPCKIKTAERQGDVVTLVGEPVTELGDIFKSLSMEGSATEFLEPELEEDVSVVETPEESNTFLLSRASAESSVSGKGPWVLKKEIEIFHADSLDTDNETVTFTINNPTVHYKIDYEEFSSINFTLSMENGVSVDLDFEGAFSKEIPLIKSVVVSLGKGFYLDLSLSAFLQADGKVSYKAELNATHCVKLDSNNPKAIQRNKKVTFNQNFESESSLEFGIQPKAMLKWGVVFKLPHKKVSKIFEVADINAEIGVCFTSKYLHLVNEQEGKETVTMRCIDFTAGPICNINVLQSNNTIMKALILEVLNLEKFDGLTIEVADPEEIHEHLECRNEEPWEEVEECTREDQACDDNGDKIQQAHIEVTDHCVILNPDGTVEVKDVATYTFDWKPGIKLSISYPQEYAENELHFHPAKYKIVYTTEKGTFTKTGEYDDFAGKSLTKTLWFFMGFLRDPNSTMLENAEEWDYYTNINFEENT